MVRRSGTWSWIVVVALALAAATACNKSGPPEAPAPTPMGEVASLGALEVSVLALELAAVELIDAADQAAIVTSGPDRVLRIRLQFKNTSEADVNYLPQHATTNADTTPQLFRTPSEGEKTPVARIASPANIFAMGQLQSETAIKPQAALVDEYLFKVPGADIKELLLVIPATVIGGDPAESVRFVLPNTPKTVGDSAPAKLGEVVKKGNLELKVTGVSDQFIEAERITSKEGEEKLKYAYAYTVEPVLRVDYEFTVAGSERLIYDPSHRADAPGVQLIVTGSRPMTVKRYKLADANATARGQLKGPMQLEPGKTYQDFFLFQRPPQSKAQLELNVSGHIFGSRGLMRFLLSYDRKEPSPPNLEPYKADEPAPAPAPAP